MVSDTIQTPFPATKEGMWQLMKKLAPFGYKDGENKELFFPVLPDDDETKEPVIALIVHDPDNGYIADRIADETGGKRLGFGPGQPALLFM